MLIIRQTPVTYVNTIAYIDTNPPKDSVGLVYWGSRRGGPPAEHRWQPARNCLQGWFTGLQVAKPRDWSQLSHWPRMPGSTGIQAAGPEIGIMLQSWSLHKDLPKRDRLGTIVLSADPTAQIRAWQPANGRAIYSFDMQVPSARAFGDGVAQVVAYFSLTDTLNKRALWLGLNCFDTRGPQAATDSVIWDKGTSTPIVRSYAGLPSGLGATSAGQFERRKWKGYRSYRWEVAGDHIVRAAELLNQYNPQVHYSLHPGQYVINGINLNPELHVPAGLRHYAHIGLSVRNWMLETAE